MASLFGLVPLGLVVSAEVYLETARREAGRAEREHRESAALAERIRALETSPRRAEEREIALSALTHTVEASARAAKVPPGALRRIVPQPPHRLGGGPYLEKETEIELHGVTLPALGQLLHRVREVESGLRVDRLRLRAPHDDPLGETWEVEAILTYLIYQPERGDGVGR